MTSRRHIGGTAFLEENGACELTREVLTRVGDKWSVLAIVLLGDGPRRFNGLKRTIDGISQRMLTVTLRGLERDGIVERTVYPTVPPQVEYGLTPLGATLLKALWPLASWVTASKDAIETARAKFDRREAAVSKTLTRSA